MARSARKAAKKSVKKSAKKPVKKAVKKTAKKSVKKSAAKSARKPAATSVAQSPRSDFSKAPPLVQSCPQCGADMKIARREPAPGQPNMERLFLECPRCGNTGGRMQAKAG
jgi:DNA-directed RNA polymerase subunit M/transcription elongation factor TFIIS